MISLMYNESLSLPSLMWSSVDKLKLLVSNFSHINFDNRFYPRQLFQQFGITELLSLNYVNIILWHQWLSSTYHFSEFNWDSILFLIIKRDMIYISQFCLQSVKMTPFLFFLLLLLSLFSKCTTITEFSW